MVGTRTRKTSLAADDTLTSRSRSRAAPRDPLRSREKSLPQCRPLTLPWQERPWPATESNAVKTQVPAASLHQQIGFAAGRSRWRRTCCSPFLCKNRPGDPSSHSSGPPLPKVADALAYSTDDRVVCAAESGASGLAAPANRRLTSPARLATKPSQQSPGLTLLESGPNPICSQPEGSFRRTCCRCGIGVRARCRAERAEERW